MEKNNIQKLNELQKAYTNIFSEIKKHNKNAEKNISNVTYEDLYMFAIKHPNALLVIENPNSEYVDKHYENIKLHKEIDESVGSIQPLINFKGIVANDNIIALYVTEKPDLEMFDVEYVRQHTHYVHGKNILKIAEKIKLCINKINIKMKDTLCGYWVDDLYFEKYNWKSVYKLNQKYVNVFNIYKGNDFKELILDPHY